ncbi:MAG: hypothetical protein O9277_00750 [Magnetospirillum sp.]|nr:hypothetical protein [Magnetospirillum sp.]
MTMDLRAHIAEFDRGRVRTRDGRYVESEAVALDAIAPGTRGVVTMRNLGQNGRMANQLPQWAFLNFYAWRHDLRLQAPDFPAAALIGAKPDPVTAPLRTLHYAPFEDEAALALWDLPAPLANIDFDGYFQEVPACWEPHRALFRRLLRFGFEDAADRWRAAIPAPLIAIHVRRGDLADPVHAAIPQFSPVPLEWYVAWVEAALTGTPGARLYIATDSPEAVRPAFARFDPSPPADFAADARIGDLLALARADALAFGNSSFGRVAGMLADEAQCQAAADFRVGALTPCAAWTEQGFWRRFGPAPAPVDPVARLAAAPAPKAPNWRKRLKIALRRALSGNA